MEKYMFRCLLENRKTIKNFIKTLENTAKIWYYIYILRNLIKKQSMYIESI